MPSDNPSGAGNEQGRLTEVELAWMAGHFDGDGWIGLMKAKRSNNGRLRYTPATVIATTSWLLSQHLIQQYRKLDVNVSVVHQAPRSETRKSVYQISTRSAISTQALLRAIRPYLVEKSYQADLVLSYIEWRETQPRHVDTGPEAEWFRHRLDVDRRRDAPSTTTRLAPGDKATHFSFRGDDIV